MGSVKEKMAKVPIPKITVNQDELIVLEELVPDT